MRQANRTLRSTPLQNPDHIEQTIFRLAALDRTADAMSLIGDASSQLQFSRGLSRFETGFGVNGSDLRPLVFPDETGTSDDWRRPANYQPVESAWYIPGPTAIIDVYAPDENTSGTLVVDDANHVIAACDAPGDNDWFAVNLTAGVTYEFGQFAWVGGLPGAEGNGIPLADAYLELRDDNGMLLSIADGGGPNTPSGLDALMTFQATYTGTYYVNATSFDNTGDGVGDFAGDYEIFARTATGTVYTTEYDISSPLHSIDWGGVRVNRAHQAVENPDGMEGPRVTGDPAADPGDVVGNSLGFPGKNVIYLYFAGEGDIYFHQDSTIPAQVVAQNPYQYEVQAMLNAANEFSKVADVVFVSNYTLNATTGLYERDESIKYKPGPLAEPGVKYAAGVDGDGFDADFFYFSYPGTPGPVISLLGSMNPPDTGDEGVAQFNSADERWSAQMLQPGGFSFVTLIHEFGHGMGLAHPHDTGGGSSVMPGVNPLLPGDDGGAGTHGLNQGVYTMMSYNDGWESSPYGSAETTNEGYGWLGSLMALDIAVIQDKYGVNEDWATGNDTYVLKDVNEWGVYIDAATGQPAVHDATNQATARDGYYVGESTYYSSIWDADGVDQIVYSGARNANIDLRAATLQYETGGAGWMSYATGIFGGFTIANGVTIENATAGAGADTLTGNNVANVLNGGGGIDILAGLGGNDILYVDNASDQALENAGEGFDAVLSSVSYALAADTEVEWLSTALTAGTAALSLTGNGIANYLIGNNGANTLNGSGGADVMIGFGADDIYVVDAADDLAFENAGEGFDAVLTSVSYVLGAGQSLEWLSTSFTAGTGAINLTGNGIGNHLIGNNGANTLDGGGGVDVMVGFAGDDIFVVDSAGDLAFENAGEGFDTVLAGASHALAAGQSIEWLSTAFTAGTAAINLSGNEVGQYLLGNNGANTLDGGTGHDVLIGFGGADNFAFTSALGGGNFDLIADFQGGSDKIQLDDAVFTQIGGLGALNANAFVTGTAAADASDRIIYNSTTGQLFYDADGTGAGGAVLFATLQGNPVLAASDFMVI
ncbi:MAG TPA: M10 family metallopeptidase C-terminal domain-containing protein [Allosphingosinicella sp.]|nr:M10 family metallopeptidase C-terminal domain-containing protein [Allosphingosinicella sp.]